MEQGPDITKVGLNTSAWSKPEVYYEMDRSGYLESADEFLFLRSKTEEPKEHEVSKLPKMETGASSLCQFRVLLLCRYQAQPTITHDEILVVE